jgi:mannose-6-phosphate isomerase-like protein (cupin superfamily)
MQNHNYCSDSLVDKAVVFYPGQGEELILNSGKITFKVTSDLSDNQLGVYEIALRPGAIGARLHYHYFIDETFIVRQGTLTVLLGDREVEAPAGSVIYIPRMTPHGFRNNSGEEVVSTLLFNPGQNREGFFRGLSEILNEQPVDPEKYLRLYRRYDSHPVDETQMLPVVP